MLGLSFPGGTSEILGRSSKSLSISGRKSHLNGFPSSWVGKMSGVEGRSFFFDLERPLLIQEAAPEYPSSLNYLEMAKKQGAWVDMEKPFWWDVPLWLASEKVDSVGLANNHLWERGMLDNEAWGRARPKEGLSFYKG